MSDTMELAKRAAACRRWRGSCPRTVRLSTSRRRTGGSPMTTDLKALAARIAAAGDGWQKPGVRVRGHEHWPRLAQRRRCMLGRGG